MNKKLWLIAAIAAVVCVMVFIIALRAGSHEDRTDRTLDTLKTFNPMTTYSDVVAELGKPVAAGEWMGANGKIRISFVDKKVSRIIYTDGRGETIYTYKALRD